VTFPLSRSAGALRWAFAAAVACLAAALAAAALAPVAGEASSHREAPLTAADPQIDNTDVYAFVSPDAPNKVTFISNWIPFEEPAGGPNFYAFSKKAHYDVRIDNTGDARADIVYRWKFRNHYRNPNTFLYNTGEVTSLDDEDLNFFQTYSLERIGPAGRTRKLVRNEIAVPSHVGDASMPDYAALRDEGVETFGPNGAGKVFAGQADDPFFLDLRVFDLLYGGDLSEVGDDTLAGFNVNALALQVPMRAVARNGNATKHPIIGVWSTASRRSTRVHTGEGEVRERGNFVQVSRLGMPLVNEVVIPVRLKDEWNASAPRGDARFLRYVQDPILARTVEAVYGIPVPDSDPDARGIQRADLVSVFLTGVEGLNMPRGVTPSEQLRLNMSIASCERGDCPEHSALGVIGGDVAGFPNGRRLADDVLDIALQVVEGELLDNPNDLGDGVGANDEAFGAAFPYVSLPHSGSDTSPHTP
jgi:hypothetical protein